MSSVMSHPSGEWSRGVKTGDPCCGPDSDRGDCLGVTILLRHHLPVFTQTAVP